MKVDSQVVPHTAWEMVLMLFFLAMMVWQSIPSFFIQLHCRTRMDWLTSSI